MGEPNGRREREEGTALVHGRQPHGHVQEQRADAHAHLQANQRHYFKIIIVNNLKLFQDNICQQLKIIYFKIIIVNNLKLFQDNCQQLKIISR